MFQQLSIQFRCQDLIRHKILRRSAEIVMISGLHLLLYWRRCARAAAADYEQCSLRRDCRSLCIRRPVNWLGFQIQEGPPSTRGTRELSCAPVHHKGSLRFFRGPVQGFGPLRTTGEWAVCISTTVAIRALPGDSRRSSIDRRAITSVHTAELVFRTAPAT